MDLTEKTPTRTQEINKFITTNKNVLKSKIYGPSFWVFKSSNKKLMFKLLTSKKVFKIDLIEKEELKEILSKFKSMRDLFNLNNTRIYANAIYYYESIDGIIKNNPQIQKINWQEEVLDFLGIIPDSDIAEILKEDVSDISNYRRKLLISSSTENFYGIDIKRFESRSIKIQDDNKIKFEKFIQKN